MLRVLVKKRDWRLLIVPRRGRLALVARGSRWMRRRGMWSGWTLASLSRTSISHTGQDPVRADWQFHSRYRDETLRYQVSRRKNHLLNWTRRGDRSLCGERSCTIWDCLSRSAVFTIDFQAARLISRHLLRFWPILLQSDSGLRFSTTRVSYVDNMACG